MNPDRALGQEHRCGAIVLAAGHARRMGRPKHLIELEGEPMLCRVVAALAASRAREIVVVLREDDAAGAALLAGMDVRIARAEDPEEGRAASVRAGVRASDPEADGWLFALADQPFLRAEDFDALIARARARPGAIVRASYEGVPGSPVLFGRAHRDALLALRGRQGGRDVIAAHRDRVEEVALAAARGRDLDTPEDLLVSRAVERTLSIVKPDAVGRGSFGAILQKIEDAGLRVVAMKMLQLDRAGAEKFYEVHKERPFYGSLVGFMTSGPVVVSVLEGDDAITRYRKLMGATNPAEADAGTVRAEFATDVEKNAVHGSDSPENAAIEVAFFFGDHELVRRS